MKSGKNCGRKIAQTLKILGFSTPGPKALKNCTNWFKLNSQKPSLKGLIKKLLKLSKNDFQHNLFQNYFWKQKYFSPTMWELRLLY